MSFRIVSYPTVHADYVTNNRNTSNLHTCTCLTDYGKFVETPLKVDNDSLMQHFLLVSESTGTTSRPKYSDRKSGQLHSVTWDFDYSRSERSSPILHFIFCISHIVVKTFLMFCFNFSTKSVFNVFFYFSMFFLNFFLNIYR